MPQMKSLYQSTNKKVRAAKLRADALDNQRAGFADFARVARQEADYLDPPALETVADMHARKGRESRDAKRPPTRLQNPVVRPVPASSTPSTTRPDPRLRAQRAANRGTVPTAPLNHVRSRTPYRAAVR